MLLLDHYLFGCGRGLKSPCCDDAYYWLDGTLYTFTGGLGSQLVSFQWLTPKPGERRVLLGREFVVYLTARRGPRVRVTWRLVRLDRTDSPLQEIAELRSALASL